MEKLDWISKSAFSLLLKCIYSPDNVFQNQLTETAPSETPTSVPPEIKSSDDTAQVASSSCSRQYIETLLMHVDPGISKLSPETTRKNNF